MTPSPETPKDAETGRCEKCGAEPREAATAESRARPSGPEAVGSDDGLGTRCEFCGAEYPIPKDR
jgi:hypothetical protein